MFGTAFAALNMLSALFKWSRMACQADAADRRKTSTCETLLPNETMDTISLFEPQKQQAEAEKLPETALF